jgi:hypothetical protein
LRKINGNDDDDDDGTGARRGMKRTMTPRARPTRAVRRVDARARVGMMDATRLETFLDFAKCIATLLYFCLL